MGKRFILFMVALGILGACSQQQSPNELWNKARTLSENDQFDESMEMYKEILAREDLADTLRAKTMFTMADLYLNHYKKYQTALDNYRNVIKNYSSTRWGPKAQFMIGYVYANHIHNYDKAKVEYQEFLDIYPTHELGEAVRFEMTYLGKDLDDIQDLEFLQSMEQN